MLPESAEIVLLAAIALAFVFVFAPAAPRRSLLLRGGAGLAGTVAIAAVPTFELVVLVLLTLGVLHAAVDGKQSFAVRLRAPALAVAVFALGLVLARAAGPQVLERVAAARCSSSSASFSVACRSTSLRPRLRGPGRSWSGRSTWSWRRPWRARRRSPASPPACCSCVGRPSCSGRSDSCLHWGCCCGFRGRCGLVAA